MSDEISAKVAELPHLPTPKLRGLWEESFSNPAPAKLRREVMIPILAYRIQEKAFGGPRKRRLPGLID
jgi:hypothetical protein